MVQAVAWAARSWLAGHEICCYAPWATLIHSTPSHLACRRFVLILHSHIRLRYFQIRVLYKLYYYTRIYGYEIFSSGFCTSFIITLASTATIFSAQGSVQLLLLHSHIRLRDFQIRVLYKFYYYTRIYGYEIFRSGFCTGFIITLASTATIFSAQGSVQVILLYSHLRLRYFQLRVLYKFYYYTRIYGYDIFSSGFCTSFIITLASTATRFSDHGSVQVSHISCACCMPCISSAFIWSS
jgi:hypothetical protein